MIQKPFSIERNSHRPARFAQVLKEELSLMIPHELKDPRLSAIPFISITEVTMTPDFYNANVAFSVFGTEDQKKITEVEVILNQAARYLKHQLMLRLKTKRTPELHFKLDKGAAYSAEMTSILNNLQSP